MENFRQRQIIERKIEMFENTLYDAELDARIAAILEDENMANNAKTTMKRVTKAIDYLKVQLEELKEDDETLTSS